MNLLNRLFKQEENKKGDELKSRLKECITNDDATQTRDHVNPNEYMELLIKYKANESEYDLKAYSSEMDAIDAAMSEIKRTETVKRLKDILKK